MSVGNRIKIVRKMYKLNQSELSNILGLSQAHISNIESNKDNPSDKMLRSISTEFKINYDWLKNGTGEIEDYKPSNKNSNTIILDLKKELNSDKALKNNSLCLAIKQLMKIYDSLEKFDTNSYLFNYFENIVSTIEECIEKMSTLPANSKDKDITIINEERAQQSQIIRELYSNRVNEQLNLLLETIENSI